MSLTEIAAKIDASVAAHAAEYRAAPVEVNPQPLVDQPWRIGTAMGDQPWHFTNETYTAKLIRCRQKLSSMETLRASGHWAFNSDRLRALREAEAALEILTGAAVLTGEAA